MDAIPALKMEGLGLAWTGDSKTFTFQKPPRNMQLKKWSASPTSSAMVVCEVSCVAQYHLGGRGKYQYTTRLALPFRGRSVYYLPCSSFRVKTRFHGLLLSSSEILVSFCLYI
jgi:hypothetical protein